MKIFSVYLRGGNDNNISKFYRGLQYFPIMLVDGPKVNDCYIL